MTTISDRLRDYENDPMWADHAEIPKHLCKEAADTIDALVAALEPFAMRVPKVARSQHPGTLVATTGIFLEFFLNADAALAKAKSCHTGNSARGNAMKDEA